MRMRVSHLEEEISPLKKDRPRQIHSVCICMADLCITGRVPIVPAEHRARAVLFSWCRTIGADHARPVAPPQGIARASPSLEDESCSSEFPSLEHYSRTHFLSAFLGACLSVALGTHRVAVVANKGCLKHTGDTRRVIRSAGNLCLRHRLLVRYST